MSFAPIETKEELEVRNAWEEFVKHFKLIFHNNLSQKELSMSFSWELEYKAIGEIGGRLLEDFFVSKLKEENDKQNLITFEPVMRGQWAMLNVYLSTTKKNLFFI